MEHNLREDYKIKVLIFAALVALTILFGYMGFGYLRPDYHPLTKVYLSLQLFTLESGAVDKPDFLEKTQANSSRINHHSQPASNLSFDQNSFGYLSYNIGRFLAAFLVFWAAMEAFLILLHSTIFVSSVKNSKGHSIIFGLGNIGKAIAEDLINRGEKLLIVEKDADNEMISYFKKKKAKVIRASALDIELLKKIRIDRCKNIIAATGNDIDNFYLLQLILNLYPDSPAKVAIHIENKALKQNLLGHELLRNKKTHIFNTNENAARMLTSKYPPDSFSRITLSGKIPVKILILGAGNFGYALLLQFIRTCHYVNSANTVITVVDKEASSLQRHFEPLCLKDIINLNFISKSPADILPSDFDDLFDAVYICDEDDATQALAALQVLKCFGNNVNVVLSANPKTPVPGTIKDAIAIFHPIIESCKYDIVINESLDRTARRIHEDWYALETKNRKEKEDRGEKVSTPKPSYKTWEELPEEYRDDNRAVVDHISIKLRMIGFANGDLITLSSKEIQKYLSANDEIVNLLANTEHRRWMAVKLLNGWKHGERDESLKLHTDLIMYEELDDKIKNYDLDQIKNLYRTVEKYFNII